MMDNLHYDQQLTTSHEHSTAPEVYPSITLVFRGTALPRGGSTRLHLCSSAAHNSATHRIQTGLA